MLLLLNSETEGKLMDNLNNDMTVKKLAKVLEAEYFAAMERITKHDIELLRSALTGVSRAQALASYKKYLPSALETITRPQDFQDVNLDNAALKWIAALNLLIRHVSFDSFANHECLTPPRCHFSHFPTSTHDVAYQFLSTVFLTDLPDYFSRQQLWLFEPPSPILDDVPFDYS